MTNSFVRRAAASLRRRIRRAVPIPADTWTADELRESARLADRAQMYRIYCQLWPDPPAPDVCVGSPAHESIPLLICLWNRPERIDEVLSLLDGQVGTDDSNAPRLRVVFWNNNAAHRQWYDDRLRSFTPSGAIDSIEIVHSPANIRGIGRFIAARALYAAGMRGSFLMLDDDETIPADGLARLLDAGGPHTIASLWAWRVHPDDYWQRERARDGEPADYTATGGCVCDLDLVADDEFFAELSELGLFIEDAWMSRFALSRGWTLRGVDIPVEFVLDETNQYRPLIWDKVHFWASLNDRYPLPDADARRRIRN